MWIFILSAAIALPAVAREQLSLENINPLVVQAEYAVRGEVPTRAAQLEEQLKRDPSSLPFSRVVKCNIGNPQSLGQKPISFTRQVLSLVMNPPLLEEVAKAKLYPEDVLERARAYIAAVPSVGAYTDSPGVPLVRQEVADFIARRDGLASVDAGNIYLTDGASSGVKTVMQTLIRGPGDAVMVPVPQYPLYSAVSTLLNGTLVPYYLNEADAWGVNYGEMLKALEAAKRQGKTVRALVVINPGNPTGQSLPAEALRDLIKLSAAEGMVFMADEVYQENVYGTAPPFYSARKAVLDLGAAAEGVQLVSFHSISKGFAGECGLRGGYFELIGFPEGVQAEITKLVSITLCSNVPGQFATGLMVNPPKPGAPSYAQYATERDSIKESLFRRAQKVLAVLQKLPGVTCNPAQGAMYLFPQLHLPRAAVAAARAAGQVPDVFYCLRLLEATGLVVVPGSGFGQVDGTYHFRTTFLPAEADIDAVLERLTVFHEAFMGQYADEL